MSNKSFCFLTVMFILSSQASGMLVPVVKPKPQVQFLPQDELFVVQLHSDLQTLGRIKSVCQYLNDATNIEAIVKNPSYGDFKSVENFLYYQAPCIPIVGINDAQGLRNRCAAIINAHVQKIDSSIELVYFPIKCGSFGKYFVDNVKLTEDDRISFYYGKLPGQIEYSSAEDYGDLDIFKNFNDHPILSDIIEAAHEDACNAARTVNIARLKVVLDRYEQFASFHALLEPLCKLGNSAILLDYLSIPERGLNYTEELNSLTALELAELYQEDELAEFLLEHEERLLQENS